MTREEMEVRRLRAVDLFRKGKSQPAVARTLGVSRNSVNRWFHRWIAGESLELRKAPGRPSKLTQAQRNLLRECVQPKMTDIEVVELIKRHTGIRYDRDHAGRLKTFWLGLRPRLSTRVA